MQKEKLIIRVSGLNQSAKCPGSAKIIANAPRDNERGATMSEGTKAHLWMQMVLDHGVLGDDPDMIKTWEWLKSRSFNTDLGLDGVAHCEEELTCEFENFILSGHPDHYVIFDSTTTPDGNVVNGYGIVNDWKFGDGQKYILPRIEDDLQGKGYAYLLFYKYPNLTHVTFNRVSVNDRVIDSIDYSIEDFGDLEKTLFSIYENQNSLTPSFTACQHCLGNENCTALLLRIRRSPIALTLAMIEEDKEIPNDALAQALQNEKYFNNAFDKLKQLAMRRLEEGQEISFDNSNARLSKFGVERVTDNATLISRLRERSIDTDKLCTVSKTAIKEAVGKENFDEFWREIKDGCVEEKEQRQIRWGK